MPMTSSPPLPPVQPSGCGTSTPAQMLQPSGPLRQAWRAQAARLLDYQLPAAWSSRVQLLLAGATAMANQHRTAISANKDLSGCLFSYPACRPAVAVPLLERRKAPCSAGQNGVVGAQMPQQPLTGASCCAGTQSLLLPLCVGIMHAMRGRY